MSKYSIIICLLLTQSAMLLARDVYLWEGFEREINWEAETDSAATGRQVSEEFASQGSHSLRVAFESSADSAEAEYGLEGWWDWSRYETLTFDVYNPTELENIRLGVVIKGGDWRDYEFRTPPLKPGWNKDIAIELRQPVFLTEASNYERKGYLIKRNDVNELKLLIYPGEATSGALHVDNFRLTRRAIISAGDLAVNNISDLMVSGGDVDYWPPGLRIRRRDLLPIESFETAIEWEEWEDDVSLGVADSHSSHGGNSLMITFPAMPDGFEVECIGLEDKLSGTGQLRIDIYNPGRPLSLSLYLEDSQGNDYESSWKYVGHGWNTEIFDFSSASGWSDSAFDPVALQELDYVAMNVYSDYPGRIYIDGIAEGEFDLRAAAIASTRFRASYCPNQDIEVIADYRAEDTYYGSELSDLRNAGPEAYLDSIKGRFDVGQWRAGLLYRYQVTSFDNPINGLVQPWALGSNIAGIELGGRMGDTQLQTLVVSKLEYEQYNSRIPTGFGPSNLFGLRLRRNLGEETRVGTTFISHGTEYGKGVSYAPPRIETWQVDIDSFLEGESVSLAIAGELGQSRGLPREDGSGARGDDSYYYATRLEPAWGRLDLSHDYTLMGYYYDAEFTGDSNYSGHDLGLGFNLEDFWICDGLSDLPIYDGSFAENLRFEVGAFRWLSRDSYLDEASGEKLPRSLGTGSNINLRNSGKAKPHFSLGMWFGRDSGEWGGNRYQDQDVYLRAPLLAGIFAGGGGHWNQSWSDDRESGESGRQWTDSYRLSFEKFFKSGLLINTNLNWRDYRSIWQGEWGEPERSFKWRLDASRPFGPDSVVSLHYGYPVLMGYDYGRQSTHNVLTLKAQTYF
jgi:hypothetical protein